MNYKINKMAHDNGIILGINVNSTSTSEVLTRVGDLISHNRRFYIVTPNPELILMSQTDQMLKKALNGSDISVSDAIGLSQAAKYLSLNLPKNILLKYPVAFVQGIIVGAATFFAPKWLTAEVKPLKGRILFMDLIDLARKNNWKVFLLGGLDSEAEIASLKLKFKYKNLNIEYNKGPRLDKEAKPVSEDDRKIESEAVAQINKFAPKIVFVAFGNPRQEIWISKNLSRLNISGAMAVGGSLRYIAGMSKLPPKWMAKIGLEWLWRGLNEPVRLGRILRAVIVFPLRVFQSKLLK